MDPNSNKCFDEQANNKMEDHVMVDIMTMIRDSGDGHVLPDCCISRVIYTMRDIRPDAYTPKFVSIGPFHYGNERLQDMERHKHSFFKRFIQRTSTNLGVLTNFVQSSVAKVRASYSENINLSDMELVKLVLVDVAFIIEFFFRIRYEGLKTLRDDAKLSQLIIVGTLSLDLVLFENQLPFFIFEELFNIAFPRGLYDDGSTFCELAYEYFCVGFDLGERNHDPNTVNVKHFTDLVRFLLLQREPQKTEPFLYTTDTLLYSAKELQEFGVKFKASKSKSLLDIKFSGHVLELPRIFVAELLTEALFLNMIAFEQIHCPFTSYVTNYFTLWGLLIKTKEDVDVLVDEKVIRSYIPDTEVAPLFRIITKNSFQLTMISEYVDIYKRLNKFGKNCWRQSKATLRRDYCRTPWQTVASFAGIIILILTILQTIFSILQVKEKK